MSKSPHERAVEKAEAAFGCSNGFSRLWDEIVQAWEMAFKVADMLREKQASHIDLQLCRCYEVTENIGLCSRCKIDDLLKEFK